MVLVVVELGGVDGVGGGWIRCTSSLAPQSSLPLKELVISIFNYR